MPVDVVLADDTVFIPDVVVHAPRCFRATGPRSPPGRRSGRPCRPVEVHSPRTRLVDLELKRVKLGEAGCPHYRLVDPDLPALRCLALRDGAYEEVVLSEGAAVVELDEPSGCG